jgi:hypothetical protein
MPNEEEANAAFMKGVCGKKTAKNRQYHLHLLLTVQVARMQDGDNSQYQEYLKLFEVN